MNKDMGLSRLETLIIALISVIVLSTFVVTKAIAEQSGSTPNSGVDSILMDTYTNLVDLGYGSEEGSNGAVWNRIVSSSTWSPTGDITEEDVRDGKTFFNGNRTLRNGSMDVVDYENQSLVVRDDRLLTDYGESATWTKTNESPEVWKDERTGLYWSASQGNYTNGLSTTCAFFSTSKRGDYDGSDSNCGNAINACANLLLDANGDGISESKWYLPSQKELFQAYVDGMFKKTNSNWLEYYWSSAEDGGNSGYSFGLYMNSGYTFDRNNGKGVANSVHCVLRDL